MPETRPSSAQRRAPAPFQGAPYSQAIIFGDLVFVAGQVALDPDTHGRRGRDRRADRAASSQTSRRSSRRPARASSSLLKTTVFLADFDDFTAMNGVYGRHVGPEPPARSTVEVAYLPSGVLVEIDAIAHL